MSVRTLLAGFALLLGSINILLSGLGVFLGGNGDLLLYGIICIVLVSFEAAYLDYDHSRKTNKEEA